MFLIIIGVAILVVYAFAAINLYLGFGRLL